MKIGILRTGDVGRRALIILLVSFVSLIAAVASERAGEAPRSLTAADYAQAEKFMSYNMIPLVLHAGVRPTWLQCDRFWYRNTVENEGSEFILVDPKRGTRAPAFDHAKVAAALSSATGKTYDATHLPFSTFDLSTDGKTISFRAEGRRWSCDLKGKACNPIEGGEAAPPEKRRGEGRRFGAGERP